MAPTDVTMPISSRSRTYFVVFARHVIAEVMSNWIGSPAVSAARSTPWPTGARPLRWRRAALPAAVLAGAEPRRTLTNPDER